MPSRLLLGQADTLLTDLLGAHLCEMFPGIQISTARTVRTLERIATDAYDLAVVDLNLEDGDLFTWLQKHRGHRGHGRVLILTTCEQEAPIDRLFRLGINTIVHRSEGLRFFEDAVRITLVGGSVFSPKIHEISERMRADPNCFSRILSDREQEVLALFGAGETSREIAASLGITEATVQDHRKNLMSKLGLKGQAQLLSYALQKGFFPGTHFNARRRGSPQ